MTALLRFKLIGLATLITPLLLFGQSSARVDSLSNVLSRYNRLDSVRWVILQELSSAYALSVPDSAVFFANQAYQVADGLKNDILLFKSLNLIGVAYIRKQAEEKAFQYFLKAVEFAKSHQEAAWRKYQAQALINVSGVLWMQDQAEKALAYAHTARNLLEVLDEPKILADNYQSIGLMYKQIDQLDSCLYYLNKALAIYQQINDLTHAGRIFEIMGRLNVQLKNYKVALLLYTEGLAIAKKESDIGNILLINNGRAQIFIEKKDYANAQQLLHDNLSRSTSESLDLYRAESYLLLSKLYLDYNQADSAYYYLNKHHELERTLLNKEKSDVINKLEIAFQAKQRAKENENLRHKNRIIQTNNKYLFIISILLFAGVISGVFYLIRVNRKNRIISEQKEKVNALLEELTDAYGHLSSVTDEKSNLVSLVTHDIQTPLSVIQLTVSSLLQEKKTNQWGTDLDMIESAANQIGYLTNRIYEIQKFESIDYSTKIKPTNVETLVKETSIPYVQWAKKKNIVVEEDIIDANLNVKADPFLLSKAFGNILGNAVKFSEQGKKVKVKISKSNDSCFISVKDNGPGISIEDQKKAFHKFQKLTAKPTFGEPSSGNGLYLAKLYIEALGGEIFIVSKLNVGSEFTLKIPLI